MTANRQLGYTLIELLVIVFLLSVILSMATLSLPSSDASGPLKDEGRRIQRLVGLLGEEAVLRSEQMAMQIYEDGYLFVRRDGQSWKTIAGDNLFRERPLDDGFVFKLSLDDQLVTLGLREPEVDKEVLNELTPQILILSSGETTAFELAIVHEDSGLSYRLEADGLGDIKLEGPLERL